MVATFVMVAALTANGYDPVADVPVYKTPGPAFKIPCKVDGAQAIERVQLYVSDNRGKSWTLHDEITPDQDAFVFQARKAGEYWFTARLKKKDGSLDPARTADFVVMQRVEVETGSGYVEPVYPKSKQPAAEAAKELEEELTRIEIELIRKEIKRLSGAKKLTPETEDKIDRLRGRLRETQARIQRDSEDPTDGLRSSPPPIFPSPYMPPSAPDDRIPPTATPPALPPIPTAPGRPAAPMPHAPATR